MMFTQRWNRLTMHFSECVPVIKQHVTIIMEFLSKNISNTIYLFSKSCLLVFNFPHNLCMKLIKRIVNWQGTGPVHLKLHLYWDYTVNKYFVSPPCLVGAWLYPIPLSVSLLQIFSSATSSDSQTVRESVMKNMWKTRPGVCLTHTDRSHAWILCNKPPVSRDEQRLVRGHLCVSVCITYI